jgi:hypothetical protein
VPGPPKIRVGFLAMLLLASIAGFRPKALQKIKYSQISFSLVKKNRSWQRSTYAKSSNEAVLVKNGT